MNKKTFIAELHDIGKLIDHKNCKYMISHYFNKEELEKIGIQTPQNKTFTGIQKHHCGKNNPYCEDEKEILNDLDIVLLIMADHFSSGFSRISNELENIVNNSFSVKDKSVYKLWNSNSRIDLTNKLIVCNTENIRKIIDIIENGDFDTLQNQCKELLKLVPENKKQLFNLVSLQTHLILVGKIYRFLKGQVESFKNGKIKFYGDIERTPTGIQDLENTVNFRIVYVSIVMPKFMARVSDLEIFKLINSRLGKLEDKDQVLFVSSESFLFICNKDSNIEKMEFVKEFLQLGLRLKTIEIIDGLSKIGQIPQELANEEIKKEYKNLIKHINNKNIPEDRKISLKEDFVKKYQSFFHSYEKERHEFVSNLCDICQSREAIPYNNLIDKEKRLVTKEEEGKAIIESVCRECLNIRAEYAKKGGLKDFAKWEDELPQPDAVWIKISLNIENLSVAFKDKYEEYIDSVLSEERLDTEFKNKYELRFTWIAEFLDDYNSFFREFYERIKLITDVILIKKDFFVAKNTNQKYLGDIITGYYDLFMKYFPDFSDVKNDGEHPIVFTLINSNVKAPLMEVWRNITSLSKKPIKLILKNGNIVEVNFDSLDYLINKVDISQKNVSSFLHRLAEMYKQSGSTIIPLTEIFNERWKYENIYKGIKEKKLSANDIINWYRMVKVEDEKN
ncbi:MAG: hypothetical protein ISS28_05795 [Candidatus Cloacimonetes bacterium]|nr:hypothetical protein [Candidatus Cloacimonadota bacterium]